MLFGFSIWGHLVASWLKGWLFFKYFFLSCLILDIKLFQYHQTRFIRSLLWIGEERRRNPIQLCLGWINFFFQLIQCWLSRLKFLGCFRLIPLILVWRKVILFIDLFIYLFTYLLISKTRDRNPMKVKKEERNDTESRSLAAFSISSSQAIPLWISWIHLFIHSQYWLIIAK